MSRKRHSSLQDIYGRAGGRIGFYAGAGVGVVIGLVVAFDFSIAYGFAIGFGVAALAPFLGIVGVLIGSGLDGLSNASSGFRKRRAPLSAIAFLRPPLDGLRRRLETLAPVLYGEVLADTLADIREEHSLATSPLEARCVLLRGCGALAAAAVCQLGHTLLDRIAALWRQARSIK